MSDINTTREEIAAAASNFKMAMEHQDAVEHSGVKGMKWGVWNDETKRKYGISVKTKAKFAGGTAAASAKLSRAMSAISAKAEARKTTRAMAAAKKKQIKAELTEQRKELGMSRKEFDRLRDRTLKSHDPKVVAKGMHTLTDDELKDKINRLSEENKISRLAADRENARHEVNAKRNEALGKNPLVQVGVNAAKPFVTKAVNELGYNVLIQQGAKPLLEQKVARAMYRAQAKENARAAAEAFPAAKSKNFKDKNTARAAGNQNSSAASYGKNTKQRSSSATPSGKDAKQQSSAKPTYEVPWGRVASSKPSKGVEIEAEVMDVIPPSVMRTKLSTSKRKSLPSGRG